MTTDPTPPPAFEEVWIFEGEGPRSGDFAASLIHLYRAEVTRTNVWRQRLDTTTNWAVLTTGAALTFAFGNPTNSHLVIIMDTL
ncbi:MAG: DUF2270 domain-containing protein, partial [Anaerolineales bacterium]|nr:DUF2270 domain-containing protein [Anaerolineales bacterium]